MLLRNLFGALMGACGSQVTTWLAQASPNRFLTLKMADAAPAGGGGGGGGSGGGAGGGGWSGGGGGGGGDDRGECSREAFGP